MKKIRKTAIKILLLSGTLFCAMSLSACHQNPMMKKDIIEWMRFRYTFDNHSGFPVESCGKYYAGNGNASLKVKCDDWSAADYDDSKACGKISANATLNDFRSKEFWKSVGAL